MPTYEISPSMYYKHIVTANLVCKLIYLSVGSAIITQHCKGYVICRRISGDITDIPYDSLKDTAGVLQGYCSGVCDLWHGRYFSI